MPAQTTRPPGRTHFKAAGTSAPTGANRIAPSSHSPGRSEEHTSELQSQSNLVCRLLLEKKKNRITQSRTSRYDVESGRTPPAHSFLLALRWPLLESQSVTTLTTDHAVPLSACTETTRL